MSTQVSPILWAACNLNYTRCGTAPGLQITVYCDGHSWCFAAERLGTRAEDDTPCVVDCQQFDGFATPEDASKAAERWVEGERNE